MAGELKPGLLEARWSSPQCGSLFLHGKQEDLSEFWEDLNTFKGLT